MSKLRQTVWKDDVKRSARQALETHMVADVAIVGGGMAGVLSAYLLAKAGKRVVLLEKKEIGEYATKHTTACITEIIDTDLADLEGTYGKENSKLILESHHKAIDLLEDSIETEHIDCEFKRCSNYLYAAKENEASSVEEEYSAGKKLGLKIEHKTDRALGFHNYGYNEVKNQAKFHPLKFLYALADKAVEKSAYIFENTEVERIDEKTMTVVAKRGSVKAEWIIAATYEPFDQPLGLFFKKGMYESYVYELRIPPNIFPEAIYEDMENPYHYFRIDRKGSYDRMIIGGEDHRQDIPVKDEKNFKALEEYIQRTFPGLSYSIIHAWDGPILEPSDGLAFIGPHKNPKILYAFGFSGNGMTYSAIAAKMFKDTIMGDGSPYSELYRTSRTLSLKPLMTKAKDYTEELAGGALKNIFKPKKKLKKKK
jgi:glycine/D-amino acid oxidase-like deaminating enzyme